MTFNEMIQALHIADLPIEMEHTFHKIQGEEHPCSTELIHHLQEKYCLFKDHFDAVLLGWEDTLRNPYRLAFTHTATCYISSVSHAKLRVMPRPITDGTPSGDLTLLFIYLPLIEKAMQDYRNRGFDEDEVRSMFQCVSGALNIHRKATGRTGMDPVYFGWVSHYIKCRLFRHEGFNYETKFFPQNTMILKNRTTSEVLAVVGNHKVHQSGMILGTAGFDTEEGAFDTLLEETEKKIVGHPVQDMLIQRERKTFSKEDWEVVIRPGDSVLNIHIPRGTDLSPAHTAFANASAMKLANERFPELSPKGFTCHSWLLEPKIGSLLDKKSNIAGFGEQFLRYPSKSDGKEMFPFVFGPVSVPIEELPEDTSLQRAIKKLYLSGGYIYAWSGIIL